VDDAPSSPSSLDEADNEAFASVDDAVELSIAAVLDEYVESLGRGEFTT
jgi:hypothetical protein